MSPLWVTILAVVAISLAAFGVCVVTLTFEHSIQGSHHSHSPASNTSVTESPDWNGSTENSRQLDHYSHHSPAFSTTATDSHYSSVSSRPTLESKPTTTEITLQNTSHSDVFITSKQSSRDVFITSKQSSIPSRPLKKKKKRRRNSCSNLLRPTRRRKRKKTGNDITRRRRPRKRNKSRNDVSGKRKRRKRIKNGNVFTSKRSRKERLKNRSDVTRRRRRQKRIKNGTDITGSKRRHRKLRKKGSDVTLKHRRRKELRKKGRGVSGKRRQQKRIKKGGDATRVLSRQKRIVQGDEVRRGQFPWMVMVVVKGGFVCGGSIIGSRHVLTAAHCLRSSYRPPKDGLSSFYNASDVEIIAGKHSYVINNSLHDVTSEQRVSVQRVIPHDKYDDTKKVAKHYDLAILELNHTLHWTKWVSSICLPRPTSNKSCLPKKATVIGWGSIKPRYRLNWIPQPPEVLQQLKVKLGGRVKCVKRLQASFQYVDYMTSRQICAVSLKTGISSTCNGDSGGPLFIKARGGQYVQLGVLSWGYCLGMPGVPSFFTYLPHFVPWIRKEIGRNGRCSQ